MPIGKNKDWPRHFAGHRLAVGRPAQHRTHPGQKLAGVKRFAQVIVGPHFQANHPVTQLAHGGQHDNGRGILLAQALAQGQTIFSGQHQVKNDQVGWLDRYGRPQRRAIDGDLHRIAVLLKEFFQ